MPEGDTVWATATRLRAALAGRELLGTDLRVPSAALVDLSRQVLVDVVARGKHLLMRTDAGYTLHSHLRMEGAWTLSRADQRIRGPMHQVRAILRTDEWTAVGYRLGTLGVVPTDREEREVGHLGPDLLGPDWDADEAVARIRALPHRAVGDAIVDQRVMAGLGNVYRSEVCFVAGVDPQTPVRAIDDLGRIVDVAKSLMEANRRGGRRVTTGDPRPGRELWVYGRAGRPCRRCATPIRSSRTSGRVTYRCPSCQPSQDPDRDRDGLSGSRGRSR
jgi:endonuclease-8